MPTPPKPGEPGSTLPDPNARPEPPPTEHPAQGPRIPREPNVAPEKQPNSKR